MKDIGIHYMGGDIYSDEIRSKKENKKTRRIVQYKLLMSCRKT